MTERAVEESVFLFEFSPFFKIVVRIVSGKLLSPTSSSLIVLIAVHM
jgi:hypothetical protein